MNLVYPLFERTQSLWGTAKAQAWVRLVGLSRTAVLFTLKNIELGCLALYEDGAKAPVTFGTEKDGYPTYILRGKDDKF
jgi:hypothetical protein